MQLSVNGNRLVFDIRQQNGKPVVAHLFSLTPLRRIVKDYLPDLRQLLSGDPHRDDLDKIEAIDMGRRAIHNDGSQILCFGAAQGGKVAVDIDTARRLFTLICVLYWKGLTPSYGRAVERSSRPPGRAVRSAR